MSTAPLPAPNTACAMSMARQFVDQMLDEATAMEQHGHIALAADIRAVANATANSAAARLGDKT